MQTLHGNHEMLERWPRIFDLNVTKDDALTAPTFSLPSHIEETTATPVIPAGPGINHVAVLHHDLSVGQRAENKCRAVIVVPIGDSAYTATIDVGAIVLGANEAILDQTISERIDAVTVCSPGKDLEPPHIGRRFRLVGIHQHQ